MYVSGRNNTDPCAQLHAHRSQVPTERRLRDQPAGLAPAHPQLQSKDVLFTQYNSAGLGNLLMHYRQCMPKHALSVARPSLLRVLRFSSHILVIPSLFVRASHWSLVCERNAPLGLQRLRGGGPLSEDMPSSPGGGRGEGWSLGAQRRATDSINSSACVCAPACACECGCASACPFTRYSAWLSAPPIETLWVVSLAGPRYPHLPRSKQLCHAG
jgi:hypothetical protein